MNDKPFMISLKAKVLKDAVDNFSESYAEQQSAEKNIFTSEDIRQAFKAGAEWYMDFSSLSDIVYGKG